MNGCRPLGNQAYDVGIVGGGVIGLSLAWQLARQGVRVAVVDQGQPGRQASWAGAGMIPPGPVEPILSDARPIEQLGGLSAQLHAEWHDQLRETVDIDNGYRRTGGIYLGAPNELQPNRTPDWNRLGIEHHLLDPHDLKRLEPNLAATDFSAILLPGEAQIRNPWHLQALLAVCREERVDVFANHAVRSFRTIGNQLTHAQTDFGDLAAAKFCITAGCWSSSIADPLGLRLSIHPIRGQIALLAGPRGLLTRNINLGCRYLVPRDDGRILVGSTEESAGFAAETTEEGIAGLLELAEALAPAIGDLPLQQSWAGLRPATHDGLPYLGRAGNWENAWIAAGHFRAGLQLSPGTAIVMAALLLGTPSPVELAEFSITRASATAAVS